MANLYKRYRADLTAATQVTIFTVPEASVAIVRSIWFANPTAASATVKVALSPAGSGLQYLVPGQTVNAGEFFDVVGTKPTGPLVLEGLDQLRVESSETGVGAIVSVLIVDRT
jgi:hypothetical protein